MVQRLHDIIVSEHLPEPTPEAVQAAQEGLPQPEPLPAVHLGEVFGLMEILANSGGRMEVFSLDNLTDYDFGHTLAVVKAGEMLGFLDTPRNVVVLTELGHRFLDADINERKSIFNERLCTLGTFQLVTRILEEAENHRISAEVVLEELAMRLPTQDWEKMLETVVAWGRFGELFGYSPDEATLFFDQPTTTTAAEKA